MTKILLATCVSGAALIGSCSTPGSSPKRPATVGSHEIVICGLTYPIDARVVRWDHRGGFNGYLETCFFDRSLTLPRSPAAGCDTPERYSVRACIIDSDDPGRSEQQLVRQYVDQIVIHYDASGTSRRCFQTLHDIRGLSSHFLIDRDGTIYQTLDVRERARHAGKANDRSVGIEIANVGAYESQKALSKALAEAGLESPGRPVTGIVQGKRLYQHRFAEAQYESLNALIRSLRKALPAVSPTLPRDGDGGVADGVLSKSRLSRFSGVLGHQHLTGRKVDPGPAFEWSRIKFR